MDDVIENHFCSLLFWNMDLLPRNDATVLALKILLLPCIHIYIMHDLNINNLLTMRDIFLRSQFISEILISWHFRGKFLKNNKVSPASNLFFQTSSWTPLFTFYLPYRVLSRPLSSCSSHFHGSTNMHHSYWISVKRDAGVKTYPCSQRYVDHYKHTKLIPSLNVGFKKIMSEQEYTSDLNCICIYCCT